MTAYCFHIADSDPARPNQIGLGFVSGTRRSNRIDIEGTLWVDTVARALHDIDFRYVGLSRRVEAVGSGGRISFREMPNGVGRVRPAIPLSPLVTFDIR